MTLRPIPNILEGMAAAIKGGTLEADPQNRDAAVYQLRQQADRLQGLAVDLLRASQVLASATTVHARTKAGEEVVAALTAAAANLKSK